MAPIKIWRLTKWCGAVFLIALGIVFVMAMSTGPRDLRISKAFYDLDELGKMLESYRADQGDFPSTDAGLNILLQPKPYIERIPRDPWGNPYVYRHPAGSKAYDLYSAGVNGIDERGGGDDVTGPSEHYSCQLYGLNCPGEITERVIAIALAAIGAVGLLGFLVFGTWSAWSRFASTRPV